MNMDGVKLFAQIKNEPEKLTQIGHTATTEVLNSELKNYYNKYRKIIIIHKRKMKQYIE